MPDAEFKAILTRAAEGEADQKNVQCLNRPLQIGRQDDEGLRSAYAWQHVDLRQEVLQRICVCRAHLQDDAGVTGDGVHLLHLRKLRESDHPLALAPAISIYMHEGEQMFSNGGTIDARCGGCDDAAIFHPFRSFVDGGR